MSNKDISTLSISDILRRESKYDLRVKEKAKKQQRILIGVAIFVFVLVLGGLFGFLYMLNVSNAESVAAINTQIAEQSSVVATLEYINNEQSGRLMALAESIEDVESQTEQMLRRHLYQEGNFATQIARLRNDVAVLQAASVPRMEFPIISESIAKLNDFIRGIVSLEHVEENHLETDNQALDENATGDNEARLTINIPFTVNIRSQPNQDGSLIHTTTRSIDFVVECQVGGWLKVSLAEYNLEHSFGYVFLDALYNNTHYTTEYDDVAPCAPVEEALPNDPQD